MVPPTLEIYDAVDVPSALKRAEQILRTPDHHLKMVAKREKPSALKRAHDVGLYQVRACSDSTGESADHQPRMVIKERASAFGQRRWAGLMGRG